MFRNLRVRIVAPVAVLALGLCPSGQARASTAAVALGRAVVAAAAAKPPDRLGILELTEEGPVPAPPRPAAAPTTAPTTGPVADLLTARKACREKERLARKLLLAARVAKEAALSAEVRARADAARADADAARKKWNEATRSFVAARLKDLDDDSYATRERGSTQLVQLGSCALALLRQARDAKNSPEVQTRLELILERIGDASDDDDADDGRVHQWAAGACASSEYGNPSWSALQATGKPDTPRGGDIQTAWAPKLQDAGIEWLELTYKQAVRPVRVRVRETYNPGAVTKVEARDAKGQWHTLWSGKDPTRECPGWLEVAVEAPAWTCRVVRVTLDTSTVSGWNEIDAVELIGEEPD